MNVVSGVWGVLEAALRRQRGKIGHQGLTLAFEGVRWSRFRSRQHDEGRAA